MVYCRSEELRKWFVVHEAELFKLKFSIENPETIEGFLKANQLSYTPIGAEEKQRLLPQLIGIGASTTVGDAKEDFYKLPFTETLSSVAHRKVFLHQGFAYIPKRELITILLDVYRKRLQTALQMTSRALPNLEEDERLVPLLNGLSKQYLGASFSGKNITGNLTADQVDTASQSFPICMKNLHQNLRVKHHLRHGGRMQYGLFLKNIGLGLEEALNFWRSEFTKIMSSDKFDKGYAYNIRHNYGKVGRLLNYSAYG